MITTGAVDGDLIEQFKNDISEYDSVIRVTQKGGQRAVKVTVQKTDTDGFGSVPHPERDLGVIEDGVIKCDDYVIGRLTGSGHAPGDKYVHHLTVSPYCTVCEDAAQQGLDDDDSRCSGCSFGDNLLTTEPGQRVVVVADGDLWGCRHDEGDRIDAEADEDGIVRSLDETDSMGNGRVFNQGRYSIDVEVVDGGDR